VIGISDQPGTSCPGRAAGCMRLQGLAQGHAVRGAARPSRGQHRQGARRQQIEVRSLGPPPDANIPSALQADRARIRRSRTSRRSRTTAAAAETPARLRGGEKEWRGTWFGLPALPSRGLKLFLKGTRCYHGEWRHRAAHFRSGQHGKRRVKLQGYGVQLAQKQKVKDYNGLLDEVQFRLGFQAASARGESPGSCLAHNLERRLDNVVYLLDSPRPAPQAARSWPTATCGVAAARWTYRGFLVKRGRSCRSGPEDGKERGLLARSSSARAARFPAAHW